MENDFLTMLLSIVDLFANGFSNISINIQDINAIADIYFLIMCKFKCLQFLRCWFGGCYRIYALQDVISLLCFEIIGDFLHFFFKSHTAA